MNGRLRLTVHAAIATIAASISLSAVYTDLRWLMPVIGAVVIVAVVSELVRRSPIPSLFGPILAAGAVLCYITGLDARAHATFGIFPGGDAMRQLGTTLRSGLDDIRKLSTPVPTHTGLVLLAVIAMAAVALVVDLIAVSMRRAAAAGLPLLAVFAVSTAVSRHGVSWIAFGIGTAGYLALLLADSRERISRWGRTLGVTQGTRITWADQGISPSPLSALGRRIGATAIAIGVVVPLVVPGLHGGLPKHGQGGNGNGHGDSNVETVNPIVTLRAQLVSRNAIPLLTYRSTDQQPPYLRLTSLSVFDGETFSATTLTGGQDERVSRGVPPPTVNGTPVTTTVHITALSDYWLPLPVQISGVKVSGEWLYDRETNTVFSTRTTTSNATYTASSVEPQPSAADLERVPFANQSDFAGYLDLPTSIPLPIGELAQTIVKHARTPFDRALAIQRFLTSPDFSYDTTVQGSDSADALAQFLFVTKRGFCQQFAASMAVLAREVGLPSRVAVGFTRGVEQPDGSWLVTTHDAHAWPEIYFEGFGWLPFEPTPRGDGQAVPPGFTSSQAPVPPGGDGSETPNNKPSPKPSLAPADRKGLDQLGANGAPATAIATHHHSSNTGLVLIAIGALLALALPTPAVARRVTTLRRWRRVAGSGRTAGSGRMAGSGRVPPWPAAHAAWAELRACAIDAHAPWQDGLSPRATARLLRAESGLGAGATEALARLVTAEERARYAPVVAADSQDGRSAVPALRADVRTVRAGLLAHCGLRRRVLAVVMPPSTMVAVHAAASRVADLLDLVDALGARIRGVFNRGAGRVAHPLAGRSAAG